MRKNIYIIILLSFFIGTTINSNAQIDAIKDLAEVGISESAEYIGTCCAPDGCFWDFSYLFIDFIVNNHRVIMDSRGINSKLVSLEINADAAYLLHKGYDKMYSYIDFLPSIRGNLGAFSGYFRYNFLTEYSNDLPNSYKSWELLFLFNFIIDSYTRISLGSGVYHQFYLDKYYNEFYADADISLAGDTDFLKLDARAVVSYNNKFPYFEANISYNKRVISFEHLFVYFSIGGVYQNYYESHDIWGAKVGLNFNIH